jgi:hypothetical protein
MKFSWKVPDPPFFQPGKSNSTECGRIDSLQFRGEARSPEKLLHIPCIAMSVKGPEFRVGAAVLLHVLQGTLVRRHT